MGTHKQRPLRLHLHMYKGYTGNLEGETRVAAKISCHLQGIFASA